MKRLIHVLIVGLLAFAPAACAHNRQLPPQASAATRAIDQTDQVARVLSYVQDGAIALNSVKVLSDRDTARVMHAMYDAGAAMKAAPSGAKAIAEAVVSSLDGDSGLSPEGKKAMQPYINFAKLFFASLAEVTK